VQPVVAQSTIQRHEVDNMLASSRELVTVTREIKYLILNN